MGGGATPAARESAVALPARQEYRLAFDLAGARLAACRGADAALLVVASAPMLLVEALLRASSGVHVVPDAPAVLARETTDVYEGVLWASPAPSTWRSRLGEIEAALGEGGVLMLLVGGGLTSILAPLRVGRSVGEPGWRAGALRRALPRRGYRLDGRLGIGGPATVAYAALSRLALLRGRIDLADRWEAGYRSTLSGPRPARLALVELLLYGKRDGQ